MPASRPSGCPINPELPHESSIRPYPPPRATAEQASEPARDLATGRRLVATTVAMGSHDPHGIGHMVDVGKAPSIRQGASFDPIAHHAADASALRRRALPLFNVAPQTEAPQLEPEPSGSPPIVTRLDHVLTRAALQKVARWSRQLRRCLKMAAAGNASMARRLRPPDLWLSVEESMRPETAAWDWDLRPLATGLPAQSSHQSEFTPPGTTICRHMHPISTTDRTHARTGPDKCRRRAEKQPQERKVRRDPCKNSGGRAPADMGG